MTRDDFDQWLKEPATKFIFAAIERAREQEKAEWLRLSWESGNSDQMQLIELRTRAEALGELTSNNFEAWIEWSEDVS